ncbi:MAG: FprA family A-type flavoprotein [Ruminococcus sp.]|nr:FprA family A-type flavoprotein [Ruminococcus sp.]
MNNIKENIFYVGVNDHELDLFEGQYVVPNGMAYNSYVVVDEKTAVLDSVDIKFGNQWLDNIAEVLGDKSPDYLIIQHMEPDHSACIDKFINKYPNAVIVGNVKTFDMLHAFFPDLELPNTLTVKEGEKLSLGNRELTFVTAPMVHWPEVMLTYDNTDKVLFSADAFGKFGALDIEEEWACEARRYYFGIVGKYGMQVQALLKKAAALDIQTICPLHGPILTKNLGYYLDLYNTWSGYGVESEGIFIAYTSVYGNTKKAAELLRDKLIEKGCPKVAIADLAREDMAECVEDGFRYGKIVLATTTYNGEMFPFMNQYIDALVERNYQNRTIGIIENGSWAAMAAKRIKAKFEKSKDIKFTETIVSIKSALKPENIAQIDALAEELLK